jgi:hypothetical protein
MMEAETNTETLHIKWNLTQQIAKEDFFAVINISEVTLFLCLIF